MSVKHGLLTLLSESPHAGYELRNLFEQRTGGTWPLNISQIYSTLQRLERDGLVICEQADTSDAALWSITEEGSAEATTWWYTASTRTAPNREEASIKIALAITSPLIDTSQVIARQRTETLRGLRDYTRLKAQLGDLRTLDQENLAWAMLLDSYIFTLEAEMRWLEHVESKLRIFDLDKAPSQGGASPAISPVAAPAKSKESSKSGIQR